MKKRVTAFLLVLLLPAFFTASVVRAQDPGSKAADLEAELYRMRSDSLDLRKTIQRLEEKLAQSRDSVSMLLQDTGEVSALRLRIKDLVKDSTALARENAKLSRQLDKSTVREKDARLRELQEQLDRSVKESASALQEKDRVLDSLGNELARSGKLLSDMGAFRDIFIAKITRDEKPYLELPFSRMDVPHLKEVLSNCAALPDNVEMAALGESFTTLLSRKETFDDLCAKVSSPLDSASLSDAASRARELLSGCGPAQREEVEAIALALEKYPRALGYIRDIMQKVRSRIEPYRTRGDATFADAAREEVDLVLLDEGPRYYEEKVFSLIPFFRDTYGRYKEELHESPLSVPSVETLILGMEL